MNNKEKLKAVIDCAVILRLVGYVNEEVLLVLKAEGNKLTKLIAAEDALNTFDENYDK